ncbi:thioredoxin 1 [Paludibacter jiangxiensis]|uniref:Thioredoxin n=2 Tax=Paludibacter jiangxiensis TaxID=681398 RepID=A0A161LUK2_9BACT|nr:thioredoxin 1 [Paludibacter jiangxiensis]
MIKMSTILIIAGIIIVVIVGYGFYMANKIKNTPEVANSEKVKVLTDKNFTQQTNKGIVLVDFWAVWCMPCKMMAPIINDVANNAPDGVTIGKLNVEEAQSIAQKYNVRSIPTTILFKDGKEINRFVGIKSKDFLLKEINKAK